MAGQPRNEGEEDIETFSAWPLTKKYIHISSIKIVLAPEQERAPLLKVPLKLECLLGTFYRPGENF